MAASDRSNAFTGFAGSEIKNVRNARKKIRPIEHLLTRHLSITSGMRSRTIALQSTFHMQPPTSSDLVSNPAVNSPNHPSIVMSSRQHHRRRTRTDCRPAVPQSEVEAVRNHSLQSSIFSPKSLIVATRKPSRPLMPGPDLADQPLLHPQEASRNVLLHFNADRRIGSKRKARLTPEMCSTCTQLHQGGTLEGVTGSLPLASSSSGTWRMTLQTMKMDR